MEFIKTPNPYEPDDSELVYKILGVNDPYVTKSPSLILKPKWSPKKSHNDVIPEELSENETIKILTEQEDQRDMDEKSRKRLRKQMRKLSGAIKTKTDTLHSSLSDLSIPSSTRSSLTEIGNILKFRKQKVKHHQQINRSISDGSGMASLLVSSIIHGPSLDSISENESCAKTGSMSELQSGGKTLEEKKFEGLVELNNKFGALETSGKSSTNISMYSVTSTETTLESDDEEDDDDDDEEDEQQSCIIESETISMVVRSVLANEVQDEYQEESEQHSLELIQEEKETVKDEAEVEEKKSLDTISEVETIEEPNPEPHRQRKSSVLHDLKDKIHHLQVAYYFCLWVSTVYLEYFDQMII